MTVRTMSVIVGCVALAVGFSIEPSRLFGQSNASPATSPSGGDADASHKKTAPAPQGDDIPEEQWTADNYRSRADALWGVKHDYAKALATYRKGTERFPKSVRILVSLSATSIDFGYRHPDSDAGRDAYKQARLAIQKGLRLIADGTGEDVDDSAKKALTDMSHQLP